MSRTLELSLIAQEHIPPAAEVLARAFADDPLCAHTQPEIEARIGQFAWLFGQLVPEGARQQGVYASVGVKGVDRVAVWTPPESESSAGADATASEKAEPHSPVGDEARAGGRRSPRLTRGARTTLRAR
jgi:hypothetical protein